MKATIALKLADETGTPTEREVTFDGTVWTSENEFAAKLLNAYARNWRRREYHPNRVSGIAQEVAASLPPELEARFVRGDKLDYSDAPPDRIY